MRVAYKGCIVIWCTEWLYEGYTTTAGIKVTLIIFDTTLTIFDILSLSWKPDNSVESQRYWDWQGVKRRFVSKIMRLGLRYIEINSKIAQIYWDKMKNTILSERHLNREIFCCIWRNFQSGWVISSLIICLNISETRSHYLWDFTNSAHLFAE